MSILPKYDSVAESYSEADYADVDGVLRASCAHGRRARPAVCSLGRAVLDIAVPATAALGSRCSIWGIDYRGVDASQGMVDVARSHAR